MLLKLHVTPGARKESVEKLGVADYAVHVHATAQKGKANKDAIALLADVLGVPKGRLRIVRGATSREKIVDLSEG